MLIIIFYCPSPSAKPPKEASKQRILVPIPCGNPDGKEKPWRHDEKAVLIPAADAIS